MAKISNRETPQTFLQLIFILTNLVLYVLSQQNETCTRTRRITPRSFFNVEDMLGLWYIHELYVGEEQDITEPNFSCLHFTFFNSGIDSLATEEVYWNMVTNVTDVLWSDIAIDPVEPAIWKRRRTGCGFMRISPRGEFNTGAALCPIIAMKL
ncbi:uncharacterized protein LOC110862453 isoform X2 [Folsomia candida]|uniref:uncharacterized protein LOC110862453 isoform X2 n=1 Tax=Folsomia candida TaxID=158441 RepID=UPI000B8FF3A4|nr:uncharacterized protein LOC110862453 isoform X2 [Folsomia candida]